MPQTTIHEQTPPAVLVLADGTVFHGVAVGAKKTTSGELCFNTSMTGYQEILTDPSYAGQIINFTFPHVGIVGCNPQDNETDYAREKLLVAGAVFCEIPDADFSSWRGKESLHHWLVAHDVPAIAGIDTRRLTKKIRDGGAIMGVMAILPDEKKENFINDLKNQVAKLDDLENKELAESASRPASQYWNEGTYNSEQNSYVDHSKKNAAGKNEEIPIVVYDYGIKNNILRLLTDMFGRVRVVNAKTPAEEILKMNPAGVFLSNGPGDPAATATYAVPIIKKLLQNKDLPLFGVCLGHQLLALALGGQTKKMELGHRGANHPVKDMAAGKVLITSQNHGFVVDGDSLPAGVEVTHRSLFDNSVAGLRIKDRPVFSVQFHPEASPGPQDNIYLFNLFKKHATKDK